MKNKLDPIDDQITPENIWNYRQNHPELIVEDLRYLIQSNLVPADSVDEIQTNYITHMIRRTLLARGVNKWFAVRRDLIAYKKQKKHQITSKQAEIRVTKALVNNTEFQSKMFYILNADLKVARAELKILEEVRGSLKRMCMRERWQIWEGKKLQDMNLISCSD